MNFGLPCLLAQGRQAQVERIPRMRKAPILYIIGHGLPRNTADLVTEGHLNCPWFSVLVRVPFYVLQPA